jgi:hypothetical protein
MKKILFFVFVLIAMNSKSQKINYLEKIPDWSNNCKHIYIGDYLKSVSDENYKPELIAIVANEYEKPTSKVSNFTNFIFFTMDNRQLFFKFKSIEKLQGKIPHNKWIYEEGEYKIILDYFQSTTRSGAGDGGDFILIKNGITLFKKSFYTL